MCGFFLNSCRLLMDVRKIKYAMPFIASYARLFLQGFSYARQIDMQPICNSILAKLYSCKVWVLLWNAPVELVHRAVDLVNGFSH
jgi:hypothetical protein